MVSIGQIIRIDGQDWTIREKKLHEGKYIYFMTCTGFEGWFSSEYIANHTTK